MTKTCRTCRLDLPTDNFHFADKKTGRLKNQCKDCAKAYYNKFKNNNEEKLKASWRNASKKYHTVDGRRNKTLRQYGLTKEDYNSMFDEQGGRCYLCGEAVTLVVDHCHVSEKVRKLLCNSCNLGLGCFKDNVVTLEKAIAYLKQFDSGVVQLGSSAGS